jgi:hypothetical protein
MNDAFFAARAEAEADPAPVSAGYDRCDIEAARRARIPICQQWRRELRSRSPNTP